MRFLPLFLLGLWLNTSLKAQLSNFQYLGEDYFDKELYLGVSLRYSDLQFPNAVPAERHNISAWTGDFLLYRTNMNPGGFRYVLRNKLLGEIFYNIQNAGDEVYRDEGSAFSHFLIGANTFSWNAVVKDRWALSIGFNISDLMIGSTFRQRDSLGGESFFTPVPHGWYIGAGPSLMADILLTDFFLLELQADYTFHFSNPVPLSYGENSPDHPKPRQSFWSAHLVTGWGLYTGLEASFLYDQTIYNGNAQKLEWQVGFRFMM